jgi:predicted enzyme related to lactoylglutathione lyase
LYYTALACGISKDGSYNGEPADHGRRNKMSTVAVHRTTHITAIAPQFLVDDLGRAIAYYRDKLGFELAFEYESFYACVTRDGCAIHLKHASKLAADREHRRQNEHLDAFISVSGIRDLFSEVERRGAQVMRPIEARPWALPRFLCRGS